MELHFKDFEMLMSNVKELRKMALDLKTPNLKDDLNVRAAIIGFSYNAATEDWSKEHFNWIQQKLTQEWTEAEAIQWGGLEIQFFAALCLGFLLGKFNAGLVGEMELWQAEMLLPGFVAMHNVQIVSAQRPKPQKAP